jgi:putative hydrolase of the HAD superfamily
MDAQKSDLRLEVRPAVRTRSPRELLIFSLDDTLIDTGLYWLARAAFSSAVAAKTGKSEPRIATVYEAWDAENKRMQAFSSGPDAVTMQDTWQALVKECDIPQESGPDLYHLIVNSLRRKFPPPIPGAEDLLKWAQPRFTLALLAAGDAENERQKIEAAKIGDYFKQVRIVPSKGREDFLALFSELGFSPRNSWVIGSSMRSDINPGIAAGANCIHYTYPRPKLNSSQEEEGDPAGAAFRIHDLLDAKAILSKPGFT